MIAKFIAFSVAAYCLTSLAIEPIQPSSDWLRQPIEEAPGAAAAITIVYLFLRSQKERDKAFKDSSEAQSSDYKAALAEAQEQSRKTTEVLNRLVTIIDRLERAHERRSKMHGA